MFRTRLIAPMLIVSFCFQAMAQPLKAPEPDGEQQHTTEANSWLTDRISFEQAEAENTIDGVPFGAQASEWKAFKLRAQPGDEVWRFSSPPESWRALAGRAGVALVRNGEIVEKFVTLMN
jgi:hypothetical protein